MKGVAKKIYDNISMGYPRTPLEGPHGSHRDSNGVTHRTADRADTGMLYIECSHAYAPKPLRDEGPITCMNCLALSKDWNP